MPLDTTPLGPACHRRRHPHGDSCRDRLDSLRQSGVRVVVPEVADDEVRREFLRVNAAAGLRRPDALAAGLIYDPITSGVVRQAAEFWADVRRRGIPSAADAALGGDATLALQTVLIGAPGDVVDVATANVAHLNRSLGVNSKRVVDRPTVPPRRTNNRPGTISVRTPGPRRIRGSDRHALRDRSGVGRLGPLMVQVVDQL